MVTLLSSVGLEQITPKHTFQGMLERTDAIRNDVLELITFVTAYSTVQGLGFSVQFWDVTHCCLI